MIVKKITERTVYPSSYESLSLQEKSDIDSFIKQSIKIDYKAGKTFRVGDYVGRKAFPDWSNTPLDPIYQYHKRIGTTDPTKQAGIDVGHLFKNAMDESPFCFEIHKGHVNYYTPV